MHRYGVCIAATFNNNSLVVCVAFGIEVVVVTPTRTIVGVTTSHLLEVPMGGLSSASV